MYHVATSFFTFRRLSQIIIPYILILLTGLLSGSENVLDFDALLGDLLTVAKVVVPPCP